LLELDVDYIKIDGSFIKGIDINEGSRKIMRVIVAFAKSINGKTITEYVHSESIWHHIRAMGIDYSQGYWISEPRKEVNDEKSNFRDR